MAGSIVFPRPLEREAAWAFITHPAGEEGVRSIVETSTSSVAHSEDLIIVREPEFHGVFSEDSESLAWTDILLMAFGALALAVCLLQAASCLTVALRRRVDTPLVEVTVGGRPAVHGAATAGNMQFNCDTVNTK
jgi:hypothetical protein